VFWVLNFLSFHCLRRFLELIILTATNAITPQLFRWGIDQGIAQQDQQIILYSAGLMVLIAIGRGYLTLGKVFGRNSFSGRCL
jgi:ATP-binding cassette subfamily B protein